MRITLIVLIAAVLQMALFLPAVGGGRALEWPLFRVDSLGLLLGAVWLLGLGFTSAPAASHAAADVRWNWAAFWLAAVGLLAVAYAREWIALYAGWELLTLAVGLARLPAQPARLPLLVPHLAGLPLLLLIIAGRLPPLAPPLGGAPEAWPLPVTLALALPVVARVVPRAWLGDRAAPTAGHAGLGALCSLAAPAVLARALVAAPWDPVGTWLLALLGTLVVLAGLWVMRFGYAQPAATTASVFGGMSVAGLGLATISPLAAAGGLALLSVSPLILPTSRAHGSPRRAMLVAGGLPGVWLLSAGSLQTGYGVVAVLLLSALALAALSLAGRAGSAETERGGYLGAVAWMVALGLLAYPQAGVEWVLRPAVGAMAGGVSALPLGLSEWGVGLAVRTPEAVTASYPSTGIAVALLLAGTTLYWLKQAVERLAFRHREGGPP